MKDMKAKIGAVEVIGVTVMLVVLGAISSFWVFHTIHTSVVANVSAGSVLPFI